MIFISYNHNDENLVDMVARRLELEFGRNNIFYDKWSMQPGDSIIDKMNEGLDKFTTFFYFLSPNSLTSKMVTKEWQSALMITINENLKFVPVRIAECKPPAIMTDALYIDLYGIGLDDAVAQMKCVAKGTNTYTPLKDVNNVKAIVEPISELLAKIELRATMFSENDANFAFIFNNEYDDFEVKPEDSAYYSSTGEIDGYNNGTPIRLKMKTIRLFRPLTPSNPVKVIVRSKNKKLQFAGVMQVLSNTEGKHIQAELSKLAWDLFDEKNK
ncbi:toll/interleukin-1 receptor domain-containing protein [Clostridium sp. Marseille-P299]|uniref:toll/interleukin-1 receptor domain-containing protein n=1 Tax=Clostridium sp. Marseille-P299 TaxID=1805477 RepID=UPI000832CB2C|nr:toll/interleukin-1 receptor domain-containing protein [Clostridium sp. Marseille-P299]